MKTTKNKENDAPSLSLHLISNNIHLLVDTVTLSHLSRTNKEANSLFKLRLCGNHYEKKLLKHVMDAKLKDAEMLLRSLRQSQRVSSGIIKTSGKERNGRISSAISPLEFAAGVSGDSDMVKLLLSYVLEENKEQALEQLKRVKSQGTEHGKYLESYHSLIDAYDEYLKNINSWNNDQLDEYWGNEIGSRQKKLPLYALKELFCINGDLRLQKFEQLFNTEPDLFSALHERFACVALYKGGFEYSTPVTSTFGRDVNTDFQKLLEINKTSVNSLEEIIHTLEQELQAKMTSFKR